MRKHGARLLAAVCVMVPLAGLAGEKQVVDITELAGSWRGWVTAEVGQERATMIVQPDGGYRASTTRGSISEGKFFLENGALRYRSSRTMGTATLSEDNGKTTLKVIPEGPSSETGPAEYERIK
jgi:hypothetical protein